MYVHVSCKKKLFLILNFRLVSLQRDMFSIIKINTSRYEVNWSVIFILSFFFRFFFFCNLIFVAVVVAVVVAVIVVVLLLLTLLYVRHHRVIYIVCAYSVILDLWIKVDNMSAITKVLYTKVQQQYVAINK